MAKEAHKGAWPEEERSRGDVHILSVVKEAIEVNTMTIIMKIFVMNTYYFVHHRQS